MAETVRAEETGRTVPRHVAIIMDGNGRWAKKRNMPRKLGHPVGAEAFKTLARYCNRIGMEQLTVFAFSTENWKRPEDEVSGIMGLLKKYLVDCFSELKNENVRMRFWGDTEILSEELRGLMDDDRSVSKDCTGLTVNVCFNYGGRRDIVRAAQQLAERCVSGSLSPDAIDEKTFSGALWSADTPDPELMIRTGGEYRISNFLLWQSAYSELYFTDTLFPDFTPEKLEEAIRWYNGRNRRFGGV